MDPDEAFDFKEGDWLFIQREITLYCKGLSEEEKLILTEGCLMNYYAAGFGR